DHVGAGVGARLVDLVRHLQAAVVPLRRDQLERQRAAADLRQLLMPEEDALARLQVEGEELGDGDGEGVEDALERGELGTRLVELDERDGAVGDAGAARQLALREAVDLAQRPQAGADVDVVLDRGLAVVERLLLAFAHAPPRSRDGSRAVKPGRYWSASGVASIPVSSALAVLRRKLRTMPSAIRQ